MFLSAKDRDRFEKKVKRGSPDECWEWQGCLDAYGYGNIWICGRNVKTHRVAWTLSFGPIPVSLCVCHRCDNRRCVNPAHLFVGTNQDNMRDKALKGRAPKRPGEENSSAKLRATDIPVIRTLGRNGISKAKIAAGFGISRRAIHHVLNYTTWSHLP